MAKTTNVEQMTPTTNGFTKAYGTAHDSEDDVSNHDDYDDGGDDDGDDDDGDDDNDIMMTILRRMVAALQ